MNRPAGARARIVAVIAVLATAVGCSVEAPDGQPRGTVTTVVTAPHQGGVEEARGVDDEVAPADDSAVTATAATVERIAARLPTGTGVAVAPVGRADEVRMAGELRSEVAWSTIKVPLAVAALRVSPESVGVADAAITVSDNPAAEALWSALGAGAGAASAVERVLAEAGDVVTTVPAERLRPGFSVFGQTRWALADQARFAAGLACLSGAEPVRQMMHRIDRSQQWGLGSVPGAAFKGGWGPTADGSGYLVRQFGLIPAGGGTTAVAIAAYGPDMNSAAAQLTGIAETILDEAHALPAGHCP